MKSRFNSSNGRFTPPHLSLGEAGRCFLFFLFFLAACNNANNTSDNKGGLPASLVNNPHSANGMDTVAAARKPTMDFKDTLHNFGPIHEDETVEHDFEFTNNGKTPLVITSATGSCGCTVADYPRDPVPGGQSALMKVTFSSRGKKGHQEKSVTIHTNTLQSIQMLFIKADIEEKK